MISLSFSDPIISAKYRVTSFFDDYFSLSGRKYKVVENQGSQKHNKIKTEETKIKSNYLITVFKITTYLMVFPLVIMGIGKVIARSQLSFYVEPTKFLPPKQEHIEKLNRETKAFKTRVLESSIASKPKEPLDFTLTSEQEKILSEIWMQSNPHTLAKSNVRMMRGGTNMVYFLDSVPQFVFKPMRNKNKAEKYVEIAKVAQQIVDENNLNLIDIPRSEVKKIGENYYVMQERAELDSGVYEWQEGLYCWSWKEKDLVPRMKMLFSQLIIFSIKSQFSDTKYDNIPLSKSGRPALIDLAESYNNWLSGALQLLEFIPADYRLEILGEVSKYLTSDQVDELKGCIDEIKPKETTEQHLKFIKDREIIISSQQINPELFRVFSDKKKQKLAKCIIEHLNKHLESSINFSLKQGRSITLDVKMNSEIHKEFQRIWGKSINYSNSSDRIDFIRIFHDLMNELKESVCICDCDKITLENKYLVEVRL